MVGIWGEGAIKIVYSAESMPNIKLLLLLIAPIISLLNERVVKK